jgi:hypothetical protein
LEQQMIEGGSVLVDALADQDPQPDRGRLHIGDFADATTIRLALKGQAVALGVGLEIFDVFNQGIEMVLGPIELQVNSH